MNNQTTTEAKVRKILTVNGMLDLEQVDEIMRLLAQEKKALLEACRKIIYSSRDETEVRKEFEALAHSQEDREGNE